MIDVHLKKYAEENWRKYLDSVEHLSRSSGDNSTPLVNSIVHVYGFDGIVNESMGLASSSSADAIRFYKKNIEIIEFKKGFKKKITKDKIDKSIMCAGGISICEDYWKKFFECQKKETKLLKNSLYMKAIESYVALEKQVFPKCEELKNQRIVFIAVIDEDGIAHSLNILEGLSNNVGGNNIFENLKLSLTDKLICKKDINGNDYFYDEIKVMSAIEFEQYIG